VTKWKRDVQFIGRGVVSRAKHVDVMARA